MKILVMRGGGVGDFILTLPVLAALRRQFPRAAIEILGYPRIAFLAVASGLADKVSPVESPELSGMFIPGGQSSFFTPFDLIVSYLYDPGGVVRANISRCSSARYICGPHRPDESLGQHATRSLLRPLEELGIQDADPRPRLNLPGKMSAEPDRLALHPGSGGMRKNWPESFWTELLAQLSDWKLLMIAGEAEGDRCRRLGGDLAPGRIAFAENLPLVDMARQMRTCAGYIGHDSGITHLAAALDLPGIALWGPSDETTWRPMSERIKVIHSEAELKPALARLCARESAV